MSDKALETFTKLGETLIDLNSRITKAENAIVTFEQTIQNLSSKLSEAESKIRDLEYKAGSFGNMKKYTYKDNVSGPLL